MHTCCLNCQNRKIEYDQQSMRKPCELDKEDCPYDIRYPEWDYKNDNQKRRKTLLEQKYHAKMKAWIDRGR